MVYQYQTQPNRVRCRSYITGRGAWALTASTLGRRTPSLSKISKKHIKPFRINGNGAGYHGFFRSTFGELEPRQEMFQRVTLTVIGYLASVYVLRQFKRSKENLYTLNSIRYLSIAYIVTM